MSEEKSVSASSPAKTKTKKNENENEKKERKNVEKKKNNKKRKKSVVDLDEVEAEAEVPNSYTEDVKEIKKDSNEKNKNREKSSRLQSKKKEKTELLKKVPESDQDGIAYTKMQIRHMLKRVKKGLAPIPTPRELDENRKNESQLRREEEELYLGLATCKVQEDNIDDDAEGEAVDNDDDGKVIEKYDTSTHNAENKSVVASNSTRNEDGSNNNDSKKKAKRNKPVPSDYICQACKNRHTPSHWIYDCPDKVTVRGANKKKKKDRGIHDPDSKKVFLSGLPFTVTAEAVEVFFSTTHNCGIVSSVRLITFKDTKRCNGQGYVSFNTEEGAKLALELSGTTIDAEAMPSEKKEKGSPAIAAERKGLKLKVSKVLNRYRTKRV